MKSHIIQLTRIVAAAALLIVLSCPPSPAEGLSGWLSINNNTSEVHEDGEKISSSDNLNQNYYLNLNRPITPRLSYQLNFRANLSDTTVTDDRDEATDTYRRTLEPAVTFFLRNSVYDLTAGYRREEEWSTASLSSEGRETTELYFSRFNLNPVALPTLSLNLQREQEYDAEHERTDRTDDLYSVSSSYNLPSETMLLNYYLIYSYGTKKTPLSFLERTENNNFSINYNLGYNDRFRGNTAGYGAGYQGYYSRQKTTLFVTQEGQFQFKRTPVEGLYKKSAPPADPLDIVLDSIPSLINEDYSDGTGIKLDDDDQNIGIELVPGQTADRLYIYYRENGLAGPVLWKVYTSGNNQTWINVATVTASPSYDSTRDAYRYEIPFAEVSDRYLKAVNTGTAQVGVDYVEISEIEAYGTDNILDKENISAVTTFNQKLTLNTFVKPLPALNVSFDYYLEKADYNPPSFPDAVTGIFDNIFSDSLDPDRTNFTSNVTRNYSLSAVWEAHRLLTTSVRLQKYENFDNSPAADNSNDTYQISFSSAPLSTLYSTLSLTRNERFMDDEKKSVIDAILLSVASRLYKNTNMINDIGYTRTDDFSPDSTTTTYTLNGTVDSQITKKLTGNLNYGIDRSSGDDTSSDSKHVILILNYQPGRFINLSGNFNVADTEGDLTVAEGVTFDWMPLPALRANLSYLHSEADPVPTRTDIINGFGIWYITKFADVRLAASYTLKEEERRTENINFSANLNCRF